jgi:hypothetical protein
MDARRRNAGRALPPPRRKDRFRASSAPRNQPPHTTWLGAFTQATMSSSDDHPALGALFERAFSGGSTRTSLARLGNVSPDEAFQVAAEIRDILATIPNEGDVREVVLKLGCRYDPARDRSTVKGWLGGLLRHCDRVQARREHGSVDGVNGSEALRSALGSEIARIGVDELSVRTMVPRAGLLAAARGKPIDNAARRALSVYPFGSYPDLQHLLGGYFYQAWELGGSWQQVVDRFVLEGRSGRLRGTAGDIDRLLAEDDATLDRVLDGIGGENVPRSGSELRGWLMEVRDRVVAGIIR